MQRAGVFGTWFPGVLLSGPRIDDIARSRPAPGLPPWGITFLALPRWTHRTGTGSPHTTFRRV
jgi:hypothetical protein